MKEGIFDKRDFASQVLLNQIMPAIYVSFFSLISSE